MAFTRHFLKTYRFVYSRCTGTLDDQDLRVHVLSFQVESKDLPFVRELLDLRDVQRAGGLTVQGMVEICELERQRSDDRDFRLAILAEPPTMIKIAQVYALLIRTDNLAARVFDDGTATPLAWLGYDAAARKKIAAFVDRHRADGVGRVQAAAGPDGR